MQTAGITGCATRPIHRRNGFRSDFRSRGPRNESQFWVLLTLLCIAPGVLAAGQPNPSPSEYPPICITHVTVVDTGTGKEARDQTVVITSARISKVGGSRSIKARANTRVVDGAGKYLIPGLWDMHVHAVFRERLDSMFPMFVANGVLGIREMGTSMPLPEIEQLRKDTRSSARLGPLIVASGPILDGQPKPRRPNFLAIRTPEEGREAVDKLSVGGADFIKVYSSLSRDAFFAIAAEASKLAGLRSRCVMPFLCAASRALQIWIAYFSACASGSGPISGVPSMYSITR
jgi:hypothetical protein